MAVLLVRRMFVMSVWMVSTVSRVTTTTVAETKRLVSFRANVKATDLVTESAIVCQLMKAGIGAAILEFVRKVIVFLRIWKRAPAAVARRMRTTWHYLAGLAMWRFMVAVIFWIFVAEVEVIRRSRLAETRVALDLVSGVIRVRAFGDGCRMSSLIIPRVNQAMETVPAAKSRPQEMTLRTSDAYIVRFAMWSYEVKTGDGAIVARANAELVSAPLVRIALRDATTHQGQVRRDEMATLSPT